MAKKSTVDARQLSFDDLDRLLDQEPGKLQKLPIDPNDIGGELLAILSKGLYTNPLDSIREYVQNSVDAQARRVTIKITANSVMIFDDGVGMSLAEMLQARQFGLSPKSLSEHVGFRGIGIYSGYDLCRRLRITSKKAGDARLHVLVFDFASMRAQLEADKRHATADHKTPLIELLSEHTEVGREPSDLASDRSFTQVELQDISDVYIRQLSNRGKLQRYLLQNLPIDFADDFEHRKPINEMLSTHVPGYHPIKITLQSDGLEDEVVSKYAGLNLRPPTFGYIRTKSGQQIAYYWACLNRERGRVEPQAVGNKSTSSEDRPTYEGFVYKMKGFTIGDRQRLREKFKRKPQLYPWYTGEIYVLDPNVVPNAERYDFETNPAKNALEMEVGIALGELETEAEKLQAQGVADERVDKYEKAIEEIEMQAASNTLESDYDTYSRLDELLRDLRRQKGKTGVDKRDLAADLMKRAERLQKQLRKEVDTPTPEATRRKHAAQDENVLRQAPLPILVPPPLVPTKTLQNILKDAGWELEGELARLVEVIQGSLEDVLALGTQSYRNVLNDIEAKLAAANSDE
jgi:hypothetical protein